MAIDNILNVNLGLQAFLEPTGDVSGLPEPGNIPSNMVPETGLARHYDLDGVDRMVERLLTPRDIPSRVLRPEVFRVALSDALESLKEVRQPDVRRFVRDDLAPILEAGQLYDIYAGLLVGG
jgi:hypothetical protein